jgi:hypothetical protein
MFETPYYVYRNELMWQLRAEVLDGQQWLAHRNAAYYPPLNVGFDNQFRCFHRPFLQKSHETQSLPQNKTSSNSPKSLAR